MVNRLRHVGVGLRRIEPAHANHEPQRAVLILRPERPTGLEARLAKVELELAELKEAFDKLMKELS